MIEPNVIYCTSLFRCEGQLGDDIWCDDRFNTRRAKERSCYFSVKCQCFHKLILQRESQTRLFSKRILDQQYIPLSRLLFQITGSGKSTNLSELFCIFYISCYRIPMNSRILCKIWNTCERVKVQGSW